MAAVTKIGVSWSLVGTEKKRERIPGKWHCDNGAVTVPTSQKKKKKDLGTIYSDINCDGDRSDI